VTEGTRDILKRALELPPEERVKLAQELLVSVEGDMDEDRELELEPAFVAELRRRAERVLSGEAGPGIPAEEALAEIERRRAERRRARGQAG